MRGAVTEAAPYSTSNAPETKEILIKSAQDVFRVMLASDIEHDSVAADGSFKPSPGVMAVLGLAGERSGAGMLWFSPRLACQVAEALLMCEFTDTTNDVLDAVGEIANMVIGNVKTEIESVLGPISLGTPTIVCGSDFRARKTNADAWTMVALRWKEELFFAGISLSSGRSSSHSRLAAANPALIPAIH